MAIMGGAVLPKANLDALLAPYNVIITEVSDRSLANLVLDISAASAAGGRADGVLGCFTHTGEIALVQGWNWYAGVDPASIGPGQYDFQTIVPHELGHTLGLGHSPDSTSVMYATLDTGAARRTLTVADLNLRESVGNGVDALRAAPLQTLATDAAMAPGPLGLGSEAKGASSGALAALPSAIPMTSEGFGLFGLSRGNLDSPAVREILGAGDTYGTDSPVSSPFAKGRDAGRTRQDWLGRGHSYDKAVDHVLDDFESVGLDDMLLGQVASGRSR